MPTREENELLTRIGPGTPMGNVLRRYWIPAAMSSELPGPDCAPIRVKLLGEKLVVFRDTQGRVGLLDGFCAHRRASLFLGRNEECGIRCVYHGWKYDVEGNCVDMPSEPPESNFKDKIHLKAYPTVEMGDIIWAYLGPKELMPPPPKFEWTQVPQNCRVVAKVWEECNWLQAVEGNVDTVHASFLHRKLTPESKRAGISPDSVWLKSSTAPRLDVKLTDYGFFYAGIRPMGQQGSFIIVNHYVLPFHQMRATTSGGHITSSLIEGHMVVPMDDENCMDYVWRVTLAGHDRAELERIERERGRSSADIGQDFRKVRNKDNDWQIDREVQRTETFSGIDGINNQDQACQESMGAICDRTQEHLGSTDKAIVAVRHLLMQAVKSVQESKDPLGTGTSYYSIRPAVKIVAPNVNWLDELKNELRSESKAEAQP